jgi:hypothetical protein
MKTMVGNAVAISAIAGVMATERRRQSKHAHHVEQAHRRVDENSMFERLLARYIHFLKFD